ncbi:CRISPR-associated endonuclease Cas4g/Cas1g [Propionibacterium australiense]|uniref:CRISPR-associated endonuclease Cas1 n=1 Tax=Propionibacterium australiense TaxID=119981 RepID=A0A383S7T6_9ACTN|nr:CRISPR-associated endonuclease Cas1 [Propionibacterium australiense]SYZ33987.1 CRISPR-associated protein Cas1 [Propionibacterium australiense]VEH88964.1 CRISPR-associated endonuclease Cas1, subtype CYANO [Propionibacterium australiense]
MGLSAVVDRVDHREGVSVPVDHKKGRPQADGQPWAADRAQVLVYAALLDAAGYTVDHAELFYAEDHVTVLVAWDDDAATELRGLVAAARELAESPVPPPPPIDSPRCPRCSLAGLCLPDETNALTERQAANKKRVLPRNPDERPLYVTEQGAYVSSRSGRIVVTKDGEELVGLRLLDISQLCVFGGVQISTQAITRILSTGAPVLWMSYGGWLNGWAQGSPSKHVQLLRRQVLSPDGTAIARQIISGKIRNQRTMLRRNAKSTIEPGVLGSLRELAGSAAAADSSSSLLGYEGTAARLYFENFTQMLSSQVELGQEFDTNGRTRRPPKDPINALLGLCYSLLVKDLVAVCLGVGLDPYIGVFHASRYGRPALALDLTEEFRPLVADSVVLNVMNNGEIGSEDFMRRGIGCQLTKQGRKKLIGAYERRLETEVTHPVFGYRISYRRCLEVQTRLLAAVLIGEIPEYKPFVTR